MPAAANINPSTYTTRSSRQLMTNPPTATTSPPVLSPRLAASFTAWLMEDNHPHRVLAQPDAEARLQVTTELLVECLNMLKTQVNPNPSPWTHPALPLGRKAVAELWEAHAAVLEPFLDKRDSTSLHCWRSFLNFLRQTAHHQHALDTEAQPAEVQQQERQPPPAQLKQEQQEEQLLRSGRGNGMGKQLLLEQQGEEADKEGKNTGVAMPTGAGVINSSSSSDNASSSQQQQQQQQDGAATLPVFTTQPHSSSTPSAAPHAVIPAPTPATAKRGRKKKDAAANAAASSVARPPQHHPPMTNNTSYYPPFFNDGNTRDPAATAAAAAAAGYVPLFYHPSTGIIYGRPPAGYPSQHQHPLPPLAPAPQPAAAFPQHRPTSQDHLHYPSSSLGASRSSGSTSGSSMATLATAANAAFGGSGGGEWGGVASASSASSGSKKRTQPKRKCHEALSSGAGYDAQPQQPQLQQSRRGRRGRRPGTGLEREQQPVGRPAKRAVAQWGGGNNVRMATIAEEEEVGSESSEEEESEEMDFVVHTLLSLGKAALPVSWASSGQHRAAPVSV